MEDLRRTYGNPGATLYETWGKTIMGGATSTKYG